MRFYVVQNDQGSTLGCELTLKAAKALGAEDRFATGSYTVEAIDCDVNAETVRRLLGQLGGYATESTTRDYSSRVQS